MAYSLFNQGQYNSSLPTLTNGQVSAVQLDSSGRQLVVVASAPSTAVTGTFWQATQPVSIASMPSTPVTGTFWQTTQPVSIASMPTTPVTGTFWQTTQPVSLASTTITGTVAVTGTFWQTTQPVSLTSTTITGTVAVTQSTSPWVTSDTNAQAQGSTTSSQNGFLELGAVTTAAPTYITGKSSPFSLDTAGNLRVNGSGVTQPVSIASMPSTPVTGTFWQTTQPVSIATMPSTPVTGTFWQTTQPVSLTSTTITGTVAVTQSTSPWVTSDNNAQAQGSTTSGQNGFLELGAVTTSAPAYTTGKTSPLSLDTTGNLRVNGSGVTQPVSVASTLTVQGAGTAGAPGTAVITVQGIASGTAQPVSGTVTATVAAVGSVASAVPSSAAYEGLIATTAYPTAATAGNLVGAMADKAGRQAVVLNSVRNLVGTAVLTSSSSSAVTLIAAGAAGVYTDITSFIATNSSSTATSITLSDGTVSYVFNIAANGGIVVALPTPIPASSTATAWTVLNSAAVSCSYVAVYCSNK